MSIEHINSKIAEYEGYIQTHRAEIKSIKGSAQYVIASEPWITLVGRELNAINVCEQAISDLRHKEDTILRQNEQGKIIILFTIVSYFFTL